MSKPSMRGEDLQCIDPADEYAALLRCYPDLMAPEDVAAFLDVGERTVASMLRDKRMRGIKVGRTWRVTKVALVRFLKENENIGCER